MSTLTLRQIPIEKCKIKNTNHHDEIVENRHYIAIIYGLSYLGKFHKMWYGGKFNKMWYGWNFDGWVNPIGIQLNAIEELYEVTDENNILKG